MFCLSLTRLDAASLAPISHTLREAFTPQNGDKPCGLPQVDLVEFRLDAFPYELERVREVREAMPIPVLFTLRTKKQGGYEERGQEELLQELWRLAHLKPDYMDIEYDVPPDWLHAFVKNFPSITPVISYHDFTCTVEEPSLLLATLPHIPSALYKIATKASSTLDALRMLAAIQKKPFLGISMGEKGQVTRILGPQKGAPWTFVSAKEKGAEGQLPYSLLQDPYAIKRLHRQSSIYALLGGEVSRSIGQWVHNRTMRALHLDSVYVKLSLEAGELPAFFPLAHELGIVGMSVTAPLKEAVLPFLDRLDPEAKAVGAVNTIRREGEEWVGFTTDGIGGVHAIEKKMTIPGKKIVVLGAGGAARALVYALRKRDAYLFIVNRTRAKGEALAKEMGVSSLPPELLSTLYDYDLLINATSAPLPLDPALLRPGSLVMDINTLPIKSPFLTCAEEKGCTLIFGYEMYLHQAVAQYGCWFPKQVAPAAAPFSEGPLPSAAYAHSRTAPDQNGLDPFLLTALIQKEVERVIFS